MADEWEITYQNHKTGRKGTCTKEEWEKLNNHPQLRGTCKLISKTQIFTPQAAVEANEAKAKETEKKSPKPAPKTKRLGGSALISKPKQN